MLMIRTERFSQKLTKVVRLQIMYNIKYLGVFRFTNMGFTTYFLQIFTAYIVYFTLSGCKEIGMKSFSFVSTSLKFSNFYKIQITFKPCMGSTQNP